MPLLLTKHSELLQNEKTSNIYNKRFGFPRSLYYIYKDDKTNRLIKRSTK